MAQSGPGVEFAVVEAVGIEDFVSEVELFIPYLDQKDR